MAGIVLTDASPVIVLARIDGMSWLKALFGQVQVPLPVSREVLTANDKADERMIRDAIERKALKVLKRDWKIPRFPHLGEGEAGCIRAALHSRKPCLILMDDKAGRATAVEHGLRVAGTAAVIAMAKRRGLISSAAAVFERLLQTDFRLSAEVIRAALESAGERT